jgi:hypothetical protein
MYQMFVLSAFCPQAFALIIISLGTILENVVGILYGPIVVA